MKRAAVALLLTLMLVPSGPASARTKNAAPRTALTATVVSEATPRRPAKVLLTVDAADPDGHITEIAVDFGDGALVFLLLACDPEAPAGTQITHEITWSYAPGSYTVAAWAYSSPDCVSGPFQQSRADVEKLKIS